jgi:carboxyl-terminal processing protease
MLRKNVGSERVSLSLATVAFLLVGQFFISPIFRVAQSQTPPSQGNVTTIDPAAVEVLEKHIAAIGGRDVNKAVKTSELQTEAEVFGMVQKATRLEDRVTGRFCQRTEGPNGSVEMGFDGKRVWQRTPSFRGYLSETDPAARRVMSREASLIEYKESGKGFARLPDEKIENKEYFVIESATTDAVSGQQVPIKYYFDPATFLLKQTVRGTAVTAKQIFDDYQKVDGIMVAFTRITETQQATIKVKVKSIKYNVTIDPVKFDFHEDSPKPENQKPSAKKEESRVPLAQPENSAAQLLPEGTRTETFEFVWGKINDTYWDRSFNGVNWKAIHDKYLPLVKLAARSDEFHSLLNQMVGELHVSHVRIMAPGAFAGLASRASDLKNGGVGLALRWINNQLAIVDVEPDSPAQAAGIRRGFVISTVNGKAPEALHTEYLKKNPGFALREEISRVRSVDAELRGSPNTKVTLDVLNDRNEIVKLELERIARPLGASFESKRLEQNVGYIGFNAFFGNVLEKFQAAARELRETRGLIIDLRGNPGGAGDMAPSIANVLSANEGSLGISKFRYGSRSFAYRGSGAEAYKGLVVLLVDELSASTSEVFAGGLQENKRTTVIGTTTAGAVLPSQVEPLPTGGALVYVVSNFQTPNGTVLEGRGVIPDIVVRLSRAGLLRGHDAPLERATEVIRAGKMVASSERAQPNISLQVSRDCVSFIKSLFSPLVATSAAT